MSRKPYQKRQDDLLKTKKDIENLSGAGFSTDVFSMSVRYKEFEGYFICECGTRVNNDTFCTTQLYKCNKCNSIYRITALPKKEYEYKYVFRKNAIAEKVIANEEQFNICANRPAREFSKKELFAGRVGNALTDYKHHKSLDILRKELVIANELTIDIFPYTFRLGKEVVLILKKPEETTLLN